MSVLLNSKSIHIFPDKISSIGYPQINFVQEVIDPQLVISFVYLSIHGFYKVNFWHNFKVKYIRSRSFQQSLLLHKITYNNNNSNQKIK